MLAVVDLGKWAEFLDLVGFFTQVGLAEVTDFTDLDGPTVLTVVDLIECSLFLKVLLELLDLYVSLREKSDIRFLSDFSELAESNARKDL